MKSICLKMIDQKEADNLLFWLKENEINDVKIHYRKFKIFYNVIIHYLGDEESKFTYQVSEILTSYIIDEYQEKLLKRCINKNYFYFDEFEKSLIIKICNKILEIQELEFEFKNQIIMENICSYIINNKFLVVKGFVNFRLNEYIEVLDYIVELAVMNYMKYI